MATVKMSFFTVKAASTAECDSSFFSDKWCPVNQSLLPQSYLDASDLAGFAGLTVLEGTEGAIPVGTDW